ncbi:MAG: transposase [Planctomycetaceae bacterium]
MAISTRHANRPPGLPVRKQFLQGLRLLHRKKELKLDGEWSHLQNKVAFETFPAPMEAKSWVTYIEPPPTESSQPADIVKYLARYLTGGPISDARLVNYEDGQVTFTARTGKTHGGSDEVEELKLPAEEFVRRWCLHILPPGFTKTRCYGGWSSRHCERYVAECRELTQQINAPDSRPESPAAEPTGPPCPVCGAELERLERVHRTSWRDIFSGPDCPQWYTFREAPG